MTLGNSCEHATTNTCECDQENKIQDGHFSIIKKWDQTFRNVKIKKRARQCRAKASL